MQKLFLLTKLKLDCTESVVIKLIYVWMKTSYFGRVTQSFPETIHTLQPVVSNRTTHFSLSTTDIAIALFPSNRSKHIIESRPPLQSNAAQVLIYKVRKYLLEFHE